MLGYATRTCMLAWAPLLSFSACDRPAAEPRASEPQTVGVTIRDSAGIEIVENHAPVWASADFWTVDPEPEFVLGGLGSPGDSAHLIWNIFGAVPLSDDRIVMLTPEGDTKVLVFEASGRLSASLGRTGRGPGDGLAIVPASDPPLHSLPVAASSPGASKPLREGFGTGQITC